MSNPVPIYSQVLPKSQQQRGYKQTSPSLQTANQSSRLFSSLRYDPRTPQPGIFDPGFDPLNHNHGGNFGQFNVNQNPEAYSRVEKFARESARRSARETGSGGRVESGSRMNAGRRERQIASHVRQAEHRINLRSLSLNEAAASRNHGLNDKTPTDSNSRLRDSMPKENSRDFINSFNQLSSCREVIHESTRDTNKDLFIPCRENSRDLKEYSGRDILRSREHILNRNSNRENTKDSSAGRDAIYENEGGIRGYHLQTEILVPDSSNRVHSVKRSTSSHKVAKGDSSASTTISEKRKFYCREWAFQKIAHCLEQRPISKTCGALILGDSGSGKTALCRELSQPGQGPAARQQRSLQRRLLARHFLQGQNENSLTMGEFIRTIVMQILNHATQHRQSLNKITTPNGKTCENGTAVVPSAPLLEEIDILEEKTPFVDFSAYHPRRTMERIHESDQYNDLLIDTDKEKPLLEDRLQKQPPRPINTNPFLPNFGSTDDREHRLYENHENLFLRNVTQNSKDVKSSRLYRQASEPPITDKKSAVLQKSLSTDSKTSNQSKSDFNVECPELPAKHHDKEVSDSKIDNKCDLSEPKVWKTRITGSPDLKNGDLNDLKLPLSPGGSNIGKVSRIPVASFKYPNVSGLSSAENSPSKLSNRSLRDGQRSSASDNSDNKEPSRVNNERKLSAASINEEKKIELKHEIKEFKPDLNELPEYQNVLKPPSCPKKLSPKMGRPGDYLDLKEDKLLNNLDFGPSAEQLKALAFSDDFLKITQDKHADASPSKVGDSINDDVPPPIPSLPVSPRTLIANFYYEKLLSEPEIQQALLPHNLEKNPDDCFKKALLFPLLEIDPPKQCLFLLVDSIDESPLMGSTGSSTLTKERDKSGSESSTFGIRNANSSKTIAELLANHHHLFPQWLLLVCTARKQSKCLTKMFTGFRKISLDDLRKNHVTLDVQRYILARLDGEPRLRQHVSRDAAQALDHLRIKSNGCFLYLERVLDGLADGSVALREIREIPGTLNGLYLWLCQRLFHGRKFSKIQPLLNILLAAKCGVDVDMLYKCLLTTNYSITREDFNKRLHLLKRILTLDTSSGVLSIFHHSFSEWLLDVKHCTRRFLCNAISGHAALAMYYTLRAPRLTPAEIHSLVLHMTRLEQHHNSIRDSKSNVDQSNEHAGEKSLSSPTLSNFKSESADDSNGLDFHTIVLLWILDSGCRIETSLRRQVDEIGRELGSLALSNNQMLMDVGFKKSSSSGLLDNNMPRPNSTHSLGINSNSAGIVQEIPEFLTSFYCPTLPRDTKVLKALLEMGAQVEIWPQNASIIEEQSLNRADDTEVDKTEGDTSYDIRASQISLEHLLMLEADEAAEEAACLQEEAIALFEVDIITGRAPIHHLAQNGDLQLLKTAYEAHESIGGSVELLELMDRAGQTGLQLAARGGKRSIVAYLLSKNARADRADSEGWTPLRAAAWGGHTEVVDLLLKHGCEVDCVDSDHRTALRAAAWSGHEEIVKLLLAHGADVNKTDLEGRTALIAAAYMGHTEIVNHLLDHGADIDHADSDGRTALAVAALCSAGGGASRGGCVQLLLERGAAPARPDKDGMTPLLVAAFEGHKEVIELLLEAEADPEVSDKAGRTPLWAAAAAGHASAVRALLFWGCCVDTIDQDGRTVLSVAAAQGNVEVVRQLVDRGLDEHHRDNAGWTPLHYAAFEGHMDVCEVLLEAGAKVDEPDNDGKGPLMLAAQEGHCRLLEYLVDEWAAPVDQHAHDGKTALRVAALEGHFEAVRTLVERGSDVDAIDADQRSTLYILALDNRESMAQYLVQKAGANVETRDSEGRTPLHVSAWQGHYEMVNLLLTIGGSCIDAKDAERRTPLHSASWRGQAAVVRLLLSKGADPNAQCDQGATPLGIASQEGHEECVLWLLQHGANPKHSDHCGRTPAKVALRAGHLHVCRLLERWGAAPPHQASLQPEIGTNTSGSTAETKACSASLSNARLSPLPITGQVQNKDCSPDSKRRSVHSSNSTKSSSNLTTSTVSSHQEVAPPVPPPHGRLPYPPEPIKEVNAQANRGNLALSFAQQVVRCGRRTGRNQTSDLPGIVSPLYATPPHSPLSDICSPTQPQQPSQSSAFDRHFCRDTHMRIILGRENKSFQPSNDNRERLRTGIVTIGNTAGAARLSCRKLVGSIGKIARRKKTTSPIVTGKSKRNGIVTNPAMRLVANVRNGLDSAAANLRRTGVALAASASSNNPAVKTNAFQWKRETPL